MSVGEDFQCESEVEAGLDESESSSSLPLTTTPASMTATPIATSATTTAISASTSATIGVQANVNAVNTCAGGWDWQGWGMVSNLFLGAVIGGILWFLWAVLRGRMPGFFSPRTWFVSPE